MCWKFNPKTCDDFQIQEGNEAFCWDTSGLAKTSLNKGPEGSVANPCWSLGRIQSFQQDTSSFSTVANDFQDIQKHENPRRAACHIFPQPIFIFLQGNKDPHHRNNPMLVGVSKYLSIWNLWPTPRCNLNLRTRVTFTEREPALRQSSDKTSSMCLCVSVCACVYVRARLIPRSLTRPGSSRYDRLCPPLSSSQTTNGGVDDWRNIREACPASCDP